LYLWHFPIILGVPLPHSFPHAVRLPIHLGLSVAAAALSYRFLEMPFLRHKHRWQTDLAPASA
jgi:peptidoglycan/LPS O-acetylase OafA/YrhL